MAGVREQVAIIGAGPAGLAAGAALKRVGVPFTIYERHADVGGLWDITNPGTPVYETAHFISSRTLSGFEDFPFPDDCPDYPGQRQVLAYLRAYADHHGLREQVATRHELTRATPLGQGGWTLEFADGRVDLARWLVAANGHLWEPNEPTYPGTFDGEAYHSRDYRSPEQLWGRRVLVVGGGNSGVDIACDAAAAAEHAAISMRRGYWFVPKHAFGVPADVIAHGGPNLPGWLERRLIALLLRWTVGDLTRFGLPKPDHQPLSSHPIVNSQLLHYLAHGDVIARPDLAELCGDKVRFTDGTMEAYDTIIWATGYHPSFPFLEHGVPWRDGAPDLHLQYASRERDDLFVLGLYETDGGAYPLLSLQAAALAEELRIQRERPELLPRLRALKAQRPDLHGGRRYLDTARHSKYLHSQTYQRLMRRHLDTLRTLQAG